MPRFFINQEISIGDTIIVPEATKKHIFVLRLNSGTHIEVFNGNGISYLACIIQITRKDITINILDQIHDINNTIYPYNQSTGSEVFNNFKLTLLMSIISSDKMDLVIQKATELNVSKIIPIITERTQQITSDRLNKKLEHWQKIAISSCEQCGRNTIPQISNPATFQEFIKLEQNTNNINDDNKIDSITYNNKIRFILSPHVLSSQTDISLSDSNNSNINLTQQIIKNVAHNKNYNEIMLFIGPEGGFTINEIQNCIKNNYYQLQIGQNILRAETAAITGITAIQALFNNYIFIK